MDAPQVQVPQVQAPQVQAPQVQVPSVQAPAPQVPSVETPSVETPSVQVPQTPVTPPVDAPSVQAPSVTTPGVNAPSVSTPEVRSPSVSAPGSPSTPDLPGLPGGGSGAGSGATGGSAGASGSSGSGAPGAPGTAPAGTITPAQARARARRLLRGGDGVLGTRFRTRAKLVRALSGCVDALPARQERLLTLRYGVGAGAPLPARRVANRLGLSAGQYAQAQRRAFRGLVRSARAGGCEIGGGAAGGTSATAASAGGSSGSASPTGGAAAGADGSSVAVLGENAAGGADEETDGGGFLGILDAFESGPINATLGALILAAVLALLGAALYRPLLAAAHRRRTPTYGEELSDRDEGFFAPFRRRVESTGNAGPARSPRTESRARVAREHRKVG